MEPNPIADVAGVFTERAQKSGGPTPLTMAPHFPIYRDKPFDVDLRELVFTNRSETDKEGSKKSAKATYKNKSYSAPTEAIKGMVQKIKDIRRRGGKVDGSVLLGKNEEGQDVILAITMNHNR